MIRLSFSAWFTGAVGLIGLVASATIAINVSAGIYPPWAAWPGFLVGLIPMAGITALAHDIRHAHREEPRKIHQIGG